MAYQNPKGTRDFLPEEMEARRAVFDRLRAVALKYNFGEIESPAIETMKLLTAKSGEGISKEIFTLEKKGDEQLGLIFDMTVPAVRMFVAQQKQVAKPVKWFYITRLWRYEAPQKGRLREFYQFGVEIFGSDKPESDAECISVAIDSLLALGLTQNDFVVKLNNRKLLQGLLYGLDIKKNIEAVVRIIDKLKKLSEKEFDLELKLLKLSEKQSEGIKKILKIKTLKELERLELNDEAQQGLDELSAVLKALKSCGKEPFAEVDLSVARGLAYYTGTVYECSSRKGELRAIFGGGRYDALVEQFGGEPCPSTGFAMGDVVLELVLGEKGLLPKAEFGPDYYIAPVSGNEKAKALEIAQKLRKKYRVEVDLMGKKLGKQLEYANSIKAKNVVIIGEEELKEGKVKIRDMKSGKERMLSISQIN